jgi:enoyl-CoA hydratase/carnithine racemase
MREPRVHLERDGETAVIVIDNPPINACSTAVRQGVMAAVEQVEADALLQGAVLIGAGSTFIAGSDLREFGQPLADPQLPAVIAAIERCTEQRSAAASSWRSAAMRGWLRPGPSSACRRCRWASFPGPAARSACPDWSAFRARSA